MHQATPITDPDGREIPSYPHVFVFGSNLAGRHGAGAAKEALRYGAVTGIGSGRVGMSYAIPTKDRSLKTLPLGVIESAVNVFIHHALSKPAEIFWVTRVGCGLAGYDDSVIAPMFNKAGRNCILSPAWEKILEETPFWSERR